MTKKIIAAILAAIMLLSTSTAFAAETANTSGKQMTISMENFTDKEFDDCKVSLTFVLNGNDRRYCYAAWNTSLNPNWTEDLGFPVLLDIKTGDKTLPTTWIPLRLACNTAGFQVEWMDKAATGEDNSYALVHTDKGDVRFYLNASVVDLPDGTQYKVTEYTLEDGSPVPLVLNRKGRLFILARGLTEALFEDARFDWTYSDRLVVYANSKGSGGVAKTYGLNKNHINTDDCINWGTLTNFNAAVEAAGKTYDKGFTGSVPEIHVLPADAGLALHITKYAGEDELRIGGFDSTESYAIQLPIIQGLLQDMVCDEDVTAIMGLLQKIIDNTSPGYSSETGATQEAINWWKAQPKNYTFSEVKVTFDEGAPSDGITITTK